MFAGSKSVETARGGGYDSLDLRSTGNRRATYHRGTPCAPVAIGSPAADKTAGQALLGTS